MSRTSVPCPQCESTIEVDHGSLPARDGTGEILTPHVIALRCEVCIAWVRIEGWSEWSATHYSMTAFRRSSDALEAFPRGTWFAVADIAIPN